MQLNLREIQDQLDGLILMTASGPLRNILTDANINLLHAMAMQREVTHGKNPRKEKLYYEQQRSN